MMVSHPSPSQGPSAKDLVSLPNQEKFWEELSPLDLHPSDERMAILSETPPLHPLVNLVDQVAIDCLELSSADSSEEQLSNPLRIGMPSLLAPSGIEPNPTTQFIDAPKTAPISLPEGGLPTKRTSLDQAGFISLSDRLTKRPSAEAQIKLVFKEIMQQKNLPTHITSLVELARSGDAAARNDLGLWCFENEEGAQKIQHIFTLFTSAALKTNPAAQCNLGYCYWVYGQDTAKNRCIIRNWVKKAIKAGYNEGWNIRGLTSLFYRSEDGKFIKRKLWRDFKKAKESFKMGADLSVRACKINLASCYRFGVGVKCNLADAEEIKLKAEMLLPSQESGHLINQVLYQFTEDNVKNLPVP